MKTSNKTKILFPALIAGLGFLLADCVTAQTTAQTITVLLNLGGDGTHPFSGLVLSGSSLYGTAFEGGPYGWGTIFVASTTSGNSSIVEFPVLNQGASPRSGLVLSGSTLYGTTSGLGGYDYGTVFAATTEGGFTNLYSFSALESGTNGDGAYPYSSLVLAGNILYGTTFNGGSSGNGTVFAVATDGSFFTNIYSFTALVSGTNSDGANGYGGLVLAGDTLYGTAVNGGSSGSGTIFSLNTNGSSFTNLYSFSALVSGTNSDGAVPGVTLLLSGSTLYGAAYNGGSSGNGTIFAVNTNGTGFTNLHNFAASVGTAGIYGFGTNSEGAHPQATSGLELSGSTLYGTTEFGGIAGNGAVFQIQTNGTQFSSLWNFSATDANGYNADGALPCGGVTLSGNTLYGTTYDGGSSGDGTVFSLTPMSLDIAQAGTNMIFTWPTNVFLTIPTNASGFTLQSSTNLGASAAWITISSSSAVVNGRNMVTLPISSVQQFFRLHEN